jgi:hypothetical protein
MNEERRRVTLTKGQCETVAGRELITLLTELSADGNVSREETERLRTWLEVDRGVDLPALSFLYEVIEQISADGDITEEELDRLAHAIERVLPKEVRAAAAQQRKQAREARRIAEREARRQTLIAERLDRRSARNAARVKAGLLYEAEFAVRGAFRNSDRREACERLVDGDVVSLEREPHNSHDANAILILGDDDCELGYVPRDKAGELARLMEGGAEAEAVVCRLWETPEGQVVPILKVKIRRGELANPVASTEPSSPNAGEKSGVATSRSGCSPILILLALLGLILAVSFVDVFVSV